MLKKLSTIHPGEILQEEFLEPLGITQYRISHDISVPPRRINEIVKGLRSITADTALRLGRYFGNSAQFWLNLQSHYDIETEEKKLSTRLKRDVKVFSLGPKHRAWIPIKRVLREVSHSEKKKNLSDFIAHDRQNH